MKALVIMAGMLFTTNAVFAGDGTKSSPYTVAELNAQKDALAASGDTVWVKANLKGLGEDGTKTENSTVDGVKQMAGLFGDDSETFVAYSWHILGELAMDDLTNTQDLLIALTYGTSGQLYGNTANVQYATNEEPETAHFSLIEVHNALKLDIKNGLRGYHIPSCFVVPQNVILVKVSAGYSSKSGAYVNYNNFDGSTATYVTPKNAAVVLMAEKGTYDITLSTGLYEQTISNGNALNPGTNAGLNTAATKNRARFRFVADGTKAGFERNSDENCTVTLDSKDEVFMQVNTLNNNFYGNYAWENEAKNWITWGGGQYSDLHAVFDFKNNNMDLAIGETGKLNDGDLAGKSIEQGDVTMTVTDGNTATRYFYNSSKGNHLQVYKNGSFTLTAKEGKAIKAIIITLQAGALLGAAADKGTLGDFDDNAKTCTWTGNNNAVTFTFTVTRYLYTINVATADADEETDSTAGVETVKAQPATADEAIYDLQGRRVIKPGKGIYVKGNKKVFIK